jgi:TolB-like protein/lipoprotein NlpI
LDTKRGLFAELKRRNVLRAGAFYLAAAWLVWQVATSVLPVLEVSTSWLRWVMVALAIGFPFWIAFAWFYEFTPEGIKRESEVERHESITHVTGRKLDFAIIGVLAVAVVLLLTDRFVLRQGVNQQAALAISEKSIAVLPFVNMSSDKEQEYFSDGISEELLNLLSKIPALHVAARTSSFSFKGKEAPIPEIAKTLLVTHVLEGSVRRSGEQVRITVQLIRAADGYHLWSETYDRKLEDIFAIQDEVAAKVVEQLKVTLLGAAPKARTTDPEAYALYLQAVQLGRQYTVEAFKQSDALFRRVLAIDPRYTPAWDGLALNFLGEASQGLMPNKEAYSQAREAAMKALEIDPEDGSTHSLLGRIAMDGNDMSVAARYYRRAIDLDPSNLFVLRNSVLLLQSLGRLDEALELHEALARRDPVNVTSLFNLGYYRRLTGRFDAAVAPFRTALSLAPGRGNARAQLGIALLLKGDAQGALAEFEQETSEVWKMIGLPMAFHALGRKTDSDAALTALIAKYEKDWSFNIAYVYAFRGEADEAFEWLDKAIEYGDPGLSDILGENLFDNIRSDPRWLPFLRKVGYAPEQLAKIDFKVTLPAEWQAEEAAAKAAATPPAPAEPKP